MAETNNANDGQAYQVQGGWQADVPGFTMAAFGLTRDAAIAEAHATALQMRDLLRKARLDG